MATTPKKTVAKTTGDKPVKKTAVKKDSNLNNDGFVKGQLLTMADLAKLRQKKK
jgi:hypothetical protein